MGKLIALHYQIKKTYIVNQISTEVVDVYGGVEEKFYIEVAENEWKNDIITIKLNRRKYVNVIVLSVYYWKFKDDLHLPK